VALLLGAQDAREVIFTSGGTESNNTAIRSILAHAGPKREIVTSRVEHSSILRLFKQLGKEGYPLRFVGVDPQGRLDLEELKQTMNDQTALVSLMMSNNETGVLVPIEAAGQIVKAQGIPFHVDAVQSVGKQGIDLKQSTIDYLSLSAHKLYGPKGVGALYARQGRPYQALIFGGGQERGRRAGTENVPGIVGMGAASRYIREHLADEMVHARQLRDYFEKLVSERIPDVFVNGGEAERLPNTSNLGFEGVDGEALLFALDQKDIWVSSGSACLSGAREPSHVLKAMGRSDEQANASLRFSFGHGTQRADLDAAVQTLSQTVRELRRTDLAAQHQHTLKETG
jgi:cysteine desulfurase